MKRVYLEITNACNLDCPFCTNSKGHDFLSLEEIKDYIDQIHEICDYIYLHVLGEPLLHPSINEILDYLDLKGMNLQLVTNGTLLNEHLDILKHKCLRKLSISLHSINNLNIDNSYFETINTLINKSSNTTIELRFYDNQNLDEKLNNYLNYLTNKYEINITKKKDSYKLKDNVYIYYQKLFDWPSINHPFVSDKGSCHGFIDQIAILHNGNVTSCCLDPYGHNSFGSLKENSLKEIINSDKYLKTIKSLKEKMLTHELCKHCEFRTRFDRNSN